MLILKIYILRNKNKKKKELKPFKFFDEIETLKNLNLQNLVF